MGGVQHTEKIAVHSVKGWCTATTMALTSVKMKVTHNSSVLFREVCIGFNIGRLSF